MATDSRTKSPARWSLQSLDSQGNGLLAEFSRDGDQFSHTLSAIQADGTSVPLLESIDQAEPLFWPSSPPIQEVHIEKHIADQPVLLAVGRSGKSHWSLSVESAASQAPSPALVFDVACRAKELPQWLGSRYQVADGISGGEFSASNCLELRLPNSETKLTVEILLPEEAATLASLKDSQITIPASPSAETLPATFRWKYRISLQSEQ